MRINYQSDFKIIETNMEGDINTPFKFKYYTEGAVYTEATFDGTAYANCRRLEDGTLLVPFNSHGLNEGILKVRREYFLTDSDFADSICNLVSVEHTGIQLWCGRTDSSTGEIDVYPNYQKGNKGDKGDPMTWESMTPGQRNILITAVVDATSANVAAIADGIETVNVSVAKAAGYFYYKKQFSAGYVMGNTCKLLVDVVDSTGTQKLVSTTGLYCKVLFKNGATSSIQFSFGKPIEMYYSAEIDSFTFYVGFEDTTVDATDRMTVKLIEESYKKRDEGVNGGVFFSDYLLSSMVKEFYYVKRDASDEISLRQMALSTGEVTVTMYKNGTQSAFVRYPIPETRRVLALFVEEGGGPGIGGYGYALLDLEGVQNGRYAFAQNCKPACFDLTNSPYIHSYISALGISHSGEALSVREKFLGLPNTVADKEAFCRQHVSNKNASTETLALYYNLRKNVYQGNTLFGQEEDFTFGIRQDGTSWANTSTTRLYANRVDGAWVEKPLAEIDLTQNSGVYDMAGKFGKVLALDLNQYLNFHFEGYPDAAEYYRLSIVALVKKYYKEVGGAITLCYHADNPYKSGSFNSIDPTHPNAVYQILHQEDGGLAKRWFDDAFGKIIDLFNSFVDDSGKKIPAMFRPFHECTFGVSKWWNNCTDEEFIELWRMMVDKVNAACTNVLWVFNPTVNSMSDESVIFRRYAGDEYADLIGSDIYFNDATTWSSSITPDTGDKIETLLPVMRRIILAAELRNKIPCLPETGNKFAPRTDFYSKQIYMRMLAQYDIRFAYMTVWANMKSATDANPFFYTPYTRGTVGADDYIDFMNKPSISNNVNLYEITTV